MVEFTGTWSIRVIDRPVSVLTKAESTSEFSVLRTGSRLSIRSDPCQARHSRLYPSISNSSCRMRRKVFAAVLLPLHVQLPGTVPRRQGLLQALDCPEPTSSVPIVRILAKELLCTPNHSVTGSLCSSILRVRKPGEFWWLEAQVRIGYSVQRSWRHFLAKKVIMPANTCKRVSASEADSPTRSGVFAPGIEQPIQRHPLLGARLGEVVLILSDKPGISRGDMRPPCVAPASVLHSGGYLLSVEMPRPSVLSTGFVQLHRPGRDKTYGQV